MIELSQMKLADYLMLNQTRQFVDLLLGMTEKELRARYKHTFFGFLWVFANPILQMIVIGFVFTFFIKQPIKHYYFFLFIGLLIWNFFSLSLTKATPSIVWERSLIKKARFPRIVIPLSIILSNMVHFLLALLVFLVPLSLLETINIGKLLLILPTSLWLLLLTVGIGALTTSLNVKYRDVNFFVQAILIVWFYATPIIYPMEFIPERFQWLWNLNPLTSIVQLFQFALLPQPFPEPTTILANILFALLLLMLGVVVFQRESKYFDDWV